MKKAEIIVDKYFLTGAVDKRIFGSFIVPCMRAFIRRTALLRMSRECERTYWSW